MFYEFKRANKINAVQPRKNQKSRAVNTHSYRFSALGVVEWLSARRRSCRCISPRIFNTSAGAGRPRTANANIASAASSLIGIATAVAGTIFPVLNSSASSLPTRHVLTLDAARRVVSATEAEARQKGWPCVIAVVDSGGYLIALDRMDASPMLASAELAPAKARTAALFGKPTKSSRGCHPRWPGSCNNRRLRRNGWRNAANC